MVNISTFKANHISFSTSSQHQTLQNENENEPTSARCCGLSPHALSIHIGHLLDNCPGLCDPGPCEWRLHMLMYRRGSDYFHINHYFHSPTEYFYCCMQDE